MRAKANTAKITPPYKSATETLWAALGPGAIAQALGQAVVLTMYEPLTVHLPGGAYTPDFFYILTDGTQVFCEVKGSTKQRGYRDARSKLRAAAEIFPFYVWAEVRVSSVARAVYDLEFLA